MFSRPLLIDRRDCDIISPNTGIEGTPSPMYQLKLQYEAIQMIYRRFGNMDKSLATADIWQYINMIEKWTSTFPPKFRIIEPDVSMDEEHSWIILHRRYLHTMTYSMYLRPLKNYLCRPYDQTEPQDEQNLRALGVDYCLKLHDAHTLLFHTIYPICANYPFAQSSLSDLAMVLCSAIDYDEHRNLPQRDMVIRAITDALEMLKQMCNVTTTASKSYGILSRLTNCLPFSQDEFQIIQRCVAKAGFVHNLQLGITCTTKSPQSIVVQVATFAQDRLGAPTTSSDSIDIYSPTAPVSVYTEPDPYGLSSLSEDLGECLPDLQPELIQRLGQAATTMLLAPGSMTSNVEVDMEQGASTQRLSQE